MRFSGGDVRGYFVEGRGSVCKSWLSKEWAEVLIPWEFLGLFFTSVYVLNGSAVEDVGYPGEVQALTALAAVVVGVNGLVFGGLALVDHFFAGRGMVGGLESKWQ